MSGGDFPPDGSNASTVLLDHIRTLRDPLPSETFLDVSSSVDQSPSYEQRTGGINNGIAGNTSRSNLQQTNEFSYFQISQNAYPTESRTQPTTPRLPRPAAYPALSSEEFAKTPKERFQAYLAPAASSSSQKKPASGARPLEPIRTSSDSIVTSKATSLREKSSPTTASPNNLRSAPAAAPVSVSSSSKPSNSIPQSSLNSAMSSVSPTASSSTSPRQTPTDTATNSPGTPNAAHSREVDPSAFIANAGSAETAVQTLLKEKQALTSRNDQLWKLVEKQRTMILGLNKDLERIVKDREKYRKRFKDKEKEVAALTMPPPPVPPIPKPSSTSGNTDASPWESSEAQRPEMAHKYGHRKEPSIDTLLSIPYQDSSDPTSGLSSSMGAPSDTYSSPTYQSRSTSSQLPLRDIDTADANAKSPDDSVVTPSSSQPKAASYASPSEGKRKAPPRPLNLYQSNQGSVHPGGHEYDDALESGSDYDEQSPPVERGRRKTREDDDRLREVAHLDEQNTSNSGKDKQDKPQVKIYPSSEGDTALKEPGQSSLAAQPPSLPAGPRNDAGLPTSPRAPLLGALQSPLPQQAQGSISSMLTQSHRPAPAPGAQAPQAQALDMPLKSPGLPLKSPGLPMSPRPGDRPVNAPAPRLPTQQLNGPGPLSPRNATVLSPRAPRQPIMLPQDASLGIMSPHVIRAEQFAQQQMDQQTTADTAHVEHIQDISKDDADPANISQIYRGFTSEQYPGLLLPPNALPLVKIEIDSSRLRPSRISYLTGKNGEEEAIFTLAISSRSDNKQLWRLEKTPYALPVLDQSLKRIPHFQAKLPDRALFSGHAPSKLDARRTALNQYFAALLETPLDDPAAHAVCDFLSTDAIGPINTSLAVSRRKEGYLAKKGKQFGGWKARYFVLDGGELRYFEGPTGGHLGSIKLAKAQIATQTTEDTSDEVEFRHAFMILEPKRRDYTSLIRHVFCAESDQERDAWVNSLMAYVEANDDGSGRPSIASDTSRMLRPGPSHSGTPSIHSISYEQTMQGGIPQQGNSRRSSNTPSPEENSAEFGALSVQAAERPNISGPVAGGPIQNAQAWGNKSPVLKENDPRKRNIFGFRSRMSEDSAAQFVQSSQPGSGHHSIDDTTQANLPHLYGNSSHSGRTIFGIPLIEAAQIFPPQGIDVNLPSPVYRCIEYLEAKNAHNEEGIFRLSGSNTVIKQIRERFNSEGDVNLLQGPPYDIHAVASLLKLYLRELPESILTRELHLDFLRVLDTEDKSARVEAVNVLAHRLPEANFELLAALTRFLIAIVNNSDVNKMTVRNVGIVFSPTLNLPAPLFSLLLTDHERIFGNPVDPTSSPVITQLDSTPASASPASAVTPVGPNDLRSPRKQMFTDLATPAYNQSSFGPQVHGDIYYQHQGQLHPNNYDIGSNAPLPPRTSTEVQNGGGQTQYRGIPAPPRMQVPDPGVAGFSSLNAALAPGLEQQK